MPYVLTDHNGVIIHISPTTGTQEETGYALVDNDTVAVPTQFIGEISDDIEVPAGVQPYTHAWIDGEFAGNPDYIPPEPSVVIPPSDIPPGAGLTGEEVAFVRGMFDRAGGNE